MKMGLISRAAAQPCSSLLLFNSCSCNCKFDATLYRRSRRRSGSNKYLLWRRKPSVSLSVEPMAAAQEGSSITTTMGSCSSSSSSILPAVIVGGGRVGQALQSMGPGNDIMIKRGERVPADFCGPIFVCTRNDDLDAVLEATPEERWSDLVFFQNGMLEPWLQSKGLHEADQVLAYFAVSKLGEPPIDGKTDLNPEGLTESGLPKWLGDFSLEVSHARESFEKQMLEKLIWISSFMLVGACHPGAKVGDVESIYHSEVTSLIEELAMAAIAETQVTFEPGLVERLCAYSRAVAHFPTAVKEFKWRNGWFYGISQKAMSRGDPDPCPLHTIWLKELKVV